MQTILFCPTTRQRRADGDRVAAGFPFNPDVPSRAA
jgi:hypothetical protein